MGTLTVSLEALTVSLGNLPVSNPGNVRFYPDTFIWKHLQSFPGNTENCVGNALFQRYCSTRTFPLSSLTFVSNSDVSSQSLTAPLIFSPTRYFHLESDFSLQVWHDIFLTKSKTYLQVWLFLSSLTFSLSLTYFSLILIFLSESDFSLKSDFFAQSNIFSL